MASVRHWTNAPVRLSTDVRNYRWMLISLFFLIIDRSSLGLSRTCCGALRYESSGQKKDPFAELSVEVYFLVSAI